MNAAGDAPEARVVDLAFPLSGQRLPDDATAALSAALQQALPWLAQEGLAGVHPLPRVQGLSGWLSARARLRLRLPRARVPQAAELAGCTLRLGPCALQLGPPQVRELLPHATLYAHAVVAADADTGTNTDTDELAFMRGVQEQLQALQVRGHTVCGRRHQHLLQGRALTTYSLMLHALSPADSLRLQECGLGPHRLLGCGVFVPHKSAAAVGE